MIAASSDLVTNAMRVLVGLVLISGTYGGVIVGYSHNALTPQHLLKRGLQDTQDRYKSLSFVHSHNNEVDRRNNPNLLSSLYIDNVINGDQEGGKPDDVERTYLLIKSFKQRDKRYVSYLTLCHFKICNMGRKRTTRYFHMIRTVDDNGLKNSKH